MACATYETGVYRVVPIERTKSLSLRKGPGGAHDNVKQSDCLKLRITANANICSPFHHEGPGRAGNSKEIVISNKMDGRTVDVAGRPRVKAVKSVVSTPILWPITAFTLTTYMDIVPFGVNRGKLGIG